MNPITSPFFDSIFYNLCKTWLLGAMGFMFVLLSGSEPAQAHGVITHMKITSAAVDYLLDQKKQGLKCGADDKEAETNFKEALTNLLLIGTAAEDSNYSDSSVRANEMGRFVFHFTPALNDSMFYIPGFRYDFTGLLGYKRHIEIPGFGTGGNVEATCSSKQWGGFDTDKPRTTPCHYKYPAYPAPALWVAGQVLGHDPTNDYTWGHARDAKELVNLEKLKPEINRIIQYVIPKGKEQESFKQFYDDSKKNKRVEKFANGFYKLGYLMHLMQDQTSPAHALNASHGHYSVKKFGIVADLGFPDPMEVDATGEEARRVPKKPTGGLVEKKPGQMFDDLHNEVVSKGFKRDNMRTRTARVVKGANSAFTNYFKNMSITQLKDAVEHPTHVPNKYIEFVKQEQKREAQITKAQQERASREWDVLGPIAVKYSASLLWAYLTTAKPKTGQCEFRMP